ncbi:MAG TPA: hypothetical protein VGM23_14800, partial [Armatimonadota bacterium]
MSRQQLAYIIALLLITAVRLPAADHQSVDPTWMPSNFYFFGGTLRPRVMVLVKDPTAPTGEAAYSKPGAQEPGAFADSYTYENVPGRYRTTFYFKVADNTNTANLFNFYVHGSVKSDPRGDQYGAIWVKGTDFAQPNVYQKFDYD